MTEAQEDKTPPRRHGAAQRPARPRPDPLGGRRARRDGTIGAAIGRKPRVRGRVENVPGARGVVRLGEAMLVIPLVKRALPEAQLPFQNAPVLGAMAAVDGRRRGPAQARDTALGGEAALAALSVLPSVVALRGGDLAAYHGVEHKAIAAYEHGDDDDARDATKEHDRCGSHLMAPMLAANVAGTDAAARVVVHARRRCTTARVALASIGLAVEVFAWSERHSDSAHGPVLRKPGHELQRVLGTREPTETQLEVGRAALEEILRVEAPPELRPRRRRIGNLDRGLLDPARWPILDSVAQLDPSVIGPEKADLVTTLQDLPIQLASAALVPVAAGRASGETIQDFATDWAAALGLVFMSSSSTSSGGR